MPDQPSGGAAVLGLALAVLVHGLAIWLTVWLLTSADVVDWELGWHRACGLGAIYIALRACNQLLFKPQG